MSGPILYFDSFGTVPDVLRDVERNVPDIFGGDSIKVVASLQANIRKYAEINKWDLIALSLSKGLARHDLEALLEEALVHKGDIIVDPTASTPEHQVFRNRSEIKSCHDRIIRVNEATEDVLMTLYGLERVDRPLMLELLMHRLRMVEATLNMIPPEEEKLQDESGKLLAGMTESRRLVRQFRQVFSLLPAGLSVAELRNIIDQDGNRIQTKMFSFYAALFGLLKIAKTPDFRGSLVMLMHNVADMSDRFADIGLDFGAYKDVQRDLQGLAQHLNPNLPPALRQSEPAPHQPHHTEQPRAEPS